MKHEVMAPGMVYYRNAIIDPEKTISTIEYIQDKIASGVNSVADKWQEWNGANPNTEKFCLKHWITDPEKVSKNDPLHQEISLIYNNIFNGINDAFKHYSNEIYPAASKNIKSTEGMLSILKYSKSGYLPPHQDQGVSSRVLSTVGYLNDNYDGGEINFPYVGVTIKPESGSVIFFPSNFVYVHEVRPMANGVRYAVPQWYHSLKDPRQSNGDE